MERPKKFTSMKQAEKFIEESGWCSYYTKFGSRYLVFKTLEDHNKWEVEHKTLTEFKPTGLK